MTTAPSSLPQFVVIVAGGSGTRMGAPIPKQFISVGGLPILMRTINRFLDYSSDISVIVVLPQSDLHYWSDLCQQYHFTPPIKIVTGGKTRFQSVKNGLNVIQAQDGLVAIHDGVRPFVPIPTIRESFEVAYKEGCAITAVPLKDSIRSVNSEGITQAVDRNLFRLIQTPQTFRLPVIRESFQQPELADFTDDASVAEKAGFPITLIDGSYQNIKITTPEDLLWAEAYVNK